MLSLGLFGGIGHWELLIIGVILLLLFGRRLPEVGRSLGQGITQFKRGLKDVTEDIDTGTTAYEPSKPLTDGSDRRVSQSGESGAPTSATASDSSKD